MAVIYIPRLTRCEQCFPRVSLPGNISRCVCRVALFCSPPSIPPSRLVITSFVKFIGSSFHVDDINFDNHFFWQPAWVIHGETVPAVLRPWNCQLSLVCDWCLHCNACKFKCAFYTHISFYCVNISEAAGAWYCAIHIAKADPLAFNVV